jgi:hypothetical protein
MQWVNWAAVESPLILEAPSSIHRYHGLKMSRIVSKYLENIFTDLVVYVVVCLVESLSDLQD